MSKNTLLYFVYYSIQVWVELYSQKPCSHKCRMHLHFRDVRNRKKAHSTIGNLPNDTILLGVKSPALPHREKEREAKAWDAPWINQPRTDLIWTWIQMAIKNVSIPNRLIPNKTVSNLQPINGSGQLTVDYFEAFSSSSKYHPELRKYQSQGAS